MTVLKTTESRVASEKTEMTAQSRLETRRRAFLDAANAAFLEKGYAGTTLGDIIARSGGSRQTLYALFGGKQGLFEATVAERNAEIFRPLRAEGHLDRAPEVVLVEIGKHFLRNVLSPQALGLFLALDPFGHGHEAKVFADSDDGLRQAGLVVVGQRRDE